MDYCFGSMRPTISLPIMHVVADQSCCRLMFVGCCSCCSSAKRKWKLSKNTFVCCCCCYTRRADGLFSCPSTTRHPYHGHNTAGYPNGSCGPAHLHVLRAASKFITDFLTCVVCVCAISPCLFGEEFNLGSNGSWFGKHQIKKPQRQQQQQLAIWTMYGGGEVN